MLDASVRLLYNEVQQDHRKRGHNMRKWILLFSIIAAVCLPFCFADANASGISLPQELTVIADEAFAGDQSLTAVTIPEGTQRIGKRAFAGCSNLASLSIPSSVTEIGDDAFWGCSSGLIVECLPGSYAAVWCAENGISCAAPVLTAYIRQEWLDMLGLVLPSTAEELVDIVNGMQKWDVNGNGKADEIGMAAADFSAFPVAFQTIEPDYEPEKVHLMMAAGESPSPAFALPLAAGAGTGQICYSIVINQFLNWLTETAHRAVSFCHSNLVFPFPKQKGHPFGCPFCFGR